MEDNFMVLSRNCINMPLNALDRNFIQEYLNLDEKRYTFYMSNFVIISSSYKQTLQNSQ